jgi:DNA-binding IclR family transcriptional regulator
MSSLSSTLAVLELFSAEHPVWTAEAIIERLGLTRPTGYRYVRELLIAGFVVRVAAGSYALGPRIIVLDYQIRQSDPLLKAGLPVIQDLGATCGCEINLIGLYGEHIVTTYQQHGVERLPLSFGRGRPMPLFRGAGSKIIVANFQRNKLRKLYEAHAAQAAEAGMGADWESFKTRMAAIRRAGHARTDGELDAGFVGLAAPVFNAEGEIMGSVVAALSRQRLGITDLNRLIELLTAAARRISADIELIGHPRVRELPAAAPAPAATPHRPKPRAARRSVPTS